MMFFKTFAINNNIILPTTAILGMILIVTGLISNIPTAFSQSTSEIQKGYKKFLKGETDFYDQAISALQSIIQSIHNAIK